MLTHQQISGIKELTAICEDHDKITLKLNFDLLENRSNQEKRDFFHYEGDELIGFIGLYGFGDTVEICGMVHPQHRRKKIFTSLYLDAIALIKDLPFTNILLNAPDRSPFAIEFLETLPCTFSFSEYQMKWEPCPIPQQVKEISLRLAQPNDLPIINVLNKVCFQSTHTISEIRQTNTEITYMIEKNPTIYGTATIVRNGNQSWICGLAIDPSYQSRGLGSEALRRLVWMEYERGQKVFLEVSTPNEQAMNIYFRNGFQTFNTQHYFEVGQ